MTINFKPGIVRDSNIDFGPLAAQVNADDVPDGPSGTKVIMTGTERTKLAGVETGATADQTGAEIKALVEALAEGSKLSASAINAGVFAPAGTTGFNLFVGLNLEWVSISQVKIKAGRCSDSTNTKTIILASDLTISLATSGKNGLDTGSEAANSWYYIWLIDDPITPEVAAVFSVNGSAPTLPSGFTKYTLLGVVRNDSSSNLWKFQKIRAGSWAKTYWLEDTQVILSVLWGGIAGSYTDVDLTAMIPPTTHTVLLIIQSVGYSFFRPKGETMLIYAQANQITSFYTSMPLSVMTLQYYTGGSSYISVQGFEETI